jgi:hypothetical protein
MSNPGKRRRSRRHAEASHRAEAVKERSAGIRDCVFEMVDLVIGRKHLPARRWDRPSHFVVCRTARQTTKTPPSRTLGSAGACFSLPRPAGGKRVRYVD